MTGIADRVAASVAFVASHQRSDGAVEWWPGGAVDPWDHVECAMALDAGGRAFEAERAYRWLQDVQQDDGSVWASYGETEPLDRTRDSNMASYVAVGVWHHYLATEDRGFLRDLWVTVRRAVDFAIGLQAEHGGVYWARDEHGRIWEDCLVAGSASVRAAILCAERVAEVLDESAATDWAPRRLALEQALREREESFGTTWEAGEGKTAFAMDWYYPVLCGVLGGVEARRRLEDGFARFVRDGAGCQCRDDQPWVTVAESSELVMAMDACGMREQAATLLEWQFAHQEADGGFRTGSTRPGGEPWPDGERPSWTAAAVVLAADAVHGLTAAGGLFRSLQPS